MPELASGGGAKLSEIVSNPEATMNRAACISVERVLLNFEKKYLNHKSPESKQNAVDEAIAAYDLYVVEQKSENLALAWKDFKKYIQRRINAKLDLITREDGTVDYIEAKTVFALVYQATVDLEPYLESEDPESDRESRLETLSNAIITLHAGAAESDERCSLGVRNDLVGTLNRVYPGVELVESTETFLHASLQHVISRIIDQLVDEEIIDRDKLYVEWLSDGEMPNILLQALIKRTTAIHAALLLACRSAGFYSLVKDKKKVAEIITPAALSYLSPVLENNKALHTLNEFYKPFDRYHVKELSCAFAVVDSWIRCHWHLGNKEVPVVMNYLLVNKVLRLLSQHEESLRSWCNEKLSSKEIDEVSEICRKYIDSTGQCNGLLGKKLLLSFIEKVKLYRKDIRYDEINSFFATFFVSGQSDKIRLQRLLFDQAFQSHVFVDDDTLLQWMTAINIDGQTVDLTPYQINRIFLTAILIGERKLNRAFIESLKKLYNWVINHFGQAQTKNSDSSREQLIPP